MPIATGRILCFANTHLYSFTMMRIGRLHLLPPVALTTLLLVTDKDKATNICVTLWEYIDERDGRLLEAGLERTIISSPRTLSIVDATALLDGNASPGSMSNTRAILSVAKRNLSLWSQHHNQRNQAAHKHRYCCPYWVALDKDQAQDIFSTATLIGIG
jgi:hypothetical protein